MAPIHPLLELVLHHQVIDSVGGLLRFQERAGRHGASEERFFRHVRSLVGRGEQGAKDILIYVGDVNIAAEVY